MSELSPIEKPSQVPGTHRILLRLSYDGTAYAGWQLQKNAVSVQQRIEETLYRLTGEEIRVTGASRTDSGVHAADQCCHFDTFSHIPPEKYPFAMNTMLPPDIRILTGMAVPEDFHARFDTVGKRYTYRIHNAPHADALRRNFTYHVPVYLNVKDMRDSLRPLLGTHDFSAFQAVGGTAKTTIRTITKAELEQNDTELTLTVCGNAFLYNMVRIIAGTMLDIGMGRLNQKAFLRALESKNRLDLGVTAPACGLELSEIVYKSVTKEETDTAGNNLSNKE